jgi:PEP-CTERM motif-containing protein
MTSSEMKRLAYAFAAGTLAAVVSAVAFVAVATATTIPLPAPTILQPTTFGDAQVYSLELLNLIQNNNKYNQNSQFDVSSGEGQIKDLLVIATGAKGTSSTNTAGVADDAYNTPSGSGDFFNTRSSEPTNGPTVGDLPNSWEVSISALIAYLTDPTTGQHNLVFIADSNQEGNDAGQTQFFWSRVQAVTAAGVNVGGCFDVNSAASGDGVCDPITQLANGNTGYPGLTGDYVENAGNFCVNATTGATYAPPCAVGDFGPVNNNIGSSNAEFAVVFPLLNTIAQLQALQALGAVNLSVELRFNNTDGPDTFWICDQCTVGGPIPPPPPPPPPSVPAPASLLLLGSGMLGAGAFAWRRARHQA